jgi:hypothetical protein
MRIRIVTEGAWPPPVSPSISSLRVEPPPPFHGEEKGEDTPHRLRPHDRDQLGGSLVASPLGAGDMRRRERSEG